MELAGPQREWCPVEHGKGAMRPKGEGDGRPDERTDNVVWDTAVSSICPSMHPSCSLGPSETFLQLSKASSKALLWPIVLMLPEAL